MGLNYDEVTEILKIIDGSSCDELIVETDDMKLVVRRNTAGVARAPSHEAAIGSAATPAPAATVPPLVPAKAVKASHQIEVTAPMVGTFYRAASPEAAPFVEIGSNVRKGDSLCLIEVMKLFTTIAAEHDGRIVQIGAENGDLVEYGRTLFVIEPA